MSSRQKVLSVDTEYVGRQSAAMSVDANRLTENATTVDADLSAHVWPTKILSADVCRRDLSV